MCVSQEYFCHCSVTVTAHPFQRSVRESKQRSPLHTQLCCYRSCSPLQLPRFLPRSTNDADSLDRPLPPPAHRNGRLPGRSCHLQHSRAHLHIRRGPRATRPHGLAIGHARRRAAPFHVDKSLPKLDDVPRATGDVRWPRGDGRRAREAAQNRTGPRGPAGRERWAQTSNPASLCSL
ncbi:hypothetical protein M427DRAFT_291208 [Gonapodya prolifera JEL478]|uniref:Uncharacterized protein n=1 Tax=Gonapodya prolifera (strain JEL478) TaxID=1344416 RepID=A0A139AI78_GONPJ|nr:hypothetical protein M427DRAFT_291208 [Gonapodya prolifera JEL478]|eukprot:KXS16487.1 hypothetical protein M427DRAFT_291208 [Gonapodya prolifera JEL478]